MSANTQLLRHADIRMTQRVYAPLGIDELRDASAAVSRNRQARVLAFRARDGA